MIERFGVELWRVVIVCYVLLLFSIATSFGQVNNYNLKLLTKQDGLAGNVLTDIIQDHYGFMWFTSGNGLCRYDGYSFKTFYQEIDNPNSIPYNRLTCIVQDDKHNFWIGTTEGVLHMDYATERFRRISLHSKPGEYPPYVSCIFIDRDKTIWVGTVKGLFMKGSDSENFQHFHNATMGQDWTYHDIVQDGHGLIWFATNHGLIQYDVQTAHYKKYTHHSDDDNGLLQTHVRRLLCDSHEDIWVCTRNSGVSRYNRHTDRFTNYTNNENKYPNCISSNSIYDLIEDKAGNIWFGSQGGGITIYNVEEESFMHLRHQPDDPKSIAWHVILSLFKDNAGGIWIGSYGAGLNYWYPAYNNFKHYGYQSGQRDGITVESVYSIFDDGEDAMWLGGYGLGSINVYHKSTGVAERLKNNLGIQGHATIIQPDKQHPDSIMWVGIDRNMGRLLYKCNRKKRSVINTYAFPSGTVIINDLLQDTDSTLWIATNNGLFKLNTANGRLEHFQNNPDLNYNLSTNYINCIAAANDSMLWIGTEYRGLDLFNKATGESTHYTNQRDSLQLNSNTINDLYLQDDSILWIATSLGLSSYDYQQTSFHNYSVNKQIDATPLSAIEEDEKGNLWISGSNGISSFNPVSRQMITFDSRHGLKNKDFWLGASFKNSNGELFFGGEKGVTSFHPDDIIYDLVVPPIVLTDMEVLNASVLVGKNQLLKKVLPATDTVVIAHTDKVISFQFAALNYAFPNSTTYSYQLEGLDDDWNYIDERRFITFTTLPPGTYLLRVKSRNNAGIWSQNEARLTIIVTPPFYQKAWFIVALIVLIIAVLYAIHRYRLYYLRNKARELKKLVNERTHELKEQSLMLQETNVLLEEKNEEITIQKEIIEAHHSKLEQLVDKRTNELKNAKEKAEESDRLKSAFLANMSHEIRTPMNAIVGFSSLLMLQELSEEDSHFVQQIYTNSESLLTLINDIMDLSKIEAGQLEIRKEPVQLAQLIREVYEIFYTTSQKPDKRSINYIFTIPDEEFTLVADPIRLKQILSNLLSNAFKFTDTGTIEVGYHQDSNKSIELFVSDTGIGIDKTDLSTIFDRFKKIEKDGVRLYRGAGLGLAIVKQLVNLMEGELLVESKEGKGSCFKFILPLKTKE